MARQIIHRLIDDLDGGDADETVRFALDGVQYEIDLSTANADRLRSLFAPYTTKGAKVARGSVVGGRSGRGMTGAEGRATNGRGRVTTDREQNQAIRDWAKRAGKDISDRGRIPQEVVTEYHAQAGR